MASAARTRHVRFNMPAEHGFEEGISEERCFTISSGVVWDQSSVLSPYSKYLREICYRTIRDCNISQV